MENNVKCKCCANYTAMLGCTKENFVLNGINNPNWGCPEHFEIRE